MPRWESDGAASVKKIQSEGWQAVGQSAVPKVAGGIQGGWRLRKGEKRTSQLILTNKPGGLDELGLRF